MQNTRFKGAIYVWDEVTAKVDVVKVDIDKKVILFSSRCIVKGKVMIDGKSEIFIL